MDFYDAVRNKRHSNMKKTEIETEDLLIVKVSNSRPLKLTMTLALFLSFLIVLSFPWMSILTVDPPPPPHHHHHPSHLAGTTVKISFPDHQLEKTQTNTNTDLLHQLLFRDSDNEGILKTASEGDRSSNNNNKNAAFIRNREAVVGRSLLGLIPNINQATKAAALSQLEDVLLEPPRAASGKSSKYFKRTRYLPDLIGDSLESYRRRVFINVQLAESAVDATTNDPNWFSNHYPTRNRKFEIYNIQTVPTATAAVAVQGITTTTISTSMILSNQAQQKQQQQQVVGMSDWLKKNVEENEYVVMKAEAEVVEEMIINGTIKLVDELFLECKHRGIKKGCKRSRRAYWECLALYGMLRDEGVAVHQWWG